jgi:hypothetical protein
MNYLDIIPDEILSIIISKLDDIKHFVQISEDYTNDNLWTLVYIQRFGITNSKEIIETNNHEYNLYLIYDDMIEYHTLIFKMINHINPNLIYDKLIRLFNINLNRSDMHHSFINGSIILRRSIKEKVSPLIFELLLKKTFSSMYNKLKVYYNLFNIIDWSSLYINYMIYKYEKYINWNCPDLSLYPELLFCNI